MSNPTPGPLYFASGSSRLNHMRGFAAIGQPIGVVASELTPATLAFLVTVEQPVFVDSGAFAEMTFGPEGPVVARPITDAEWTRRMAMYLTIARALGGRAHLVAPDRIGDQRETLRRLTLFAAELREMRELGAKILVPVQKGHQTQAEFIREVELVLGFSDFVHAIPSKKNATTLAELRAYVEAVRPRAVHLLGLGIRNPSAPAALETIASAVPEAVVSLDSCMIMANVGRKPTPRKLTAACDRAAELLAKVRGATMHHQELGVILAFGTEQQATEALWRAAVVPRAAELLRAVAPELEGAAAVRGLELTTRGPDQQDLFAA